MSKSTEQLNLDFLKFSRSIILAIVSMHRQEDGRPERMSIGTTEIWEKLGMKSRQNFAR